MTASEPWTAIEPAALGDWLAGRRWFGDKSRSIADVRPEPLAVVTIDGRDVALLDLTVSFAEGDPARYFAPVSLLADGAFADAFEDPAWLGWLGSGFNDQRAVPVASSPGTIVWDALGAESQWASETPRVLSGEQSNTSVLFGETAILKLFRRLQSGVNPDSEIVAYLTQEGSYTHVPPYLGSIRLVTGEEGEGIELAAVQGFVANQGDSWRWLPGALTSSDEAHRDALLDAIRLLGTRTGELHVALGHGAGEAFAPTPYSRADTDALEERLGREVLATTATLHRVGACSYVESEELTGALLRDISRVGVLEGLPQIRVHGDYHLGQVLRADGDFVIIDFEGEPSRSLAERRQKASPLKDVAGMVRSINYAVATARLSADAGTGDAGLVAWGEAAEQEFVQGYLDVVGDSTLALVPREADVFRQALDVFMIEKALYEVRYELDNRPDWIDIPLGALRRIAQDR